MSAYCIFVNVPEQKRGLVPCAHQMARKFQSRAREQPPPLLVLSPQRRPLSGWLSAPAPHRTAHCLGPRGHLTGEGPPPSKGRKQPRLRDSDRGRGRVTRATLSPNRARGYYLVRKSPKLASPHKCSKNRPPVYSEDERPPGNKTTRN